MSELTTGELIKEYKKSIGLTTQQLAEKVGKSRSYISLIENNKENPSQSLIDDIARVLSEYLVNHYNDRGENDSSISTKEYVFREIRDDLYLSRGFKIPLDKVAEEVYKNSGRLEIDKEETHLLDKPYYDLVWLLEQPANDVFYRFETEDGGLHVVNLNDKEKGHIKHILDAVMRLRFDDSRRNKGD